MSLSVKGGPGRINGIAIKMKKEEALFSYRYKMSYRHLELIFIRFY
jgi:hypothetical protein